jgi:phospholipase A1
VVTRLSRCGVAALWSLCFLGAWPLAAHAQLSACARIADPSERLRCYDDLARAESALPRERVESPAAPTPAPPHAGDSLSLKATALESRWELRPDLKRGIFNLLPHRPVLGLLHWTSDRNPQPTSPTRPFDATQRSIEFERAEGKIQLSFKTKMAEGLFGSPADLWFGYTQVSYWQLGNRRYSSPFRETNYEPEATVMFPVNYGLGDLRLRFLGFTLNHQSNGRGGSLSRSWNRVIAEAGAEYGAWSFHLRPWVRVFDPDIQRDDNPDIEDYAGRGELAVAWRRGGHVVTATARHTLRFDERSRGSMRLDWAFPLVGALNGHLQLFSGYGLNLIDYNHRQTTLGLGVSFLD